MKLLVLTLSGARPQDLFEDERLENLRRLMAFGCYGRLGFSSKTVQVDVRAALEESFRSLWAHIGSLGFARIQVGLSPERWDASPDAVCIESLLEPGDQVEPKVSPGSLAAEIQGLLQERPPPGKAAEAGDHLGLVLTRSLQQFSIVRHLLQTQPWSFFQLVETGLKLLVENRPSAQTDAIRAYGLHLDREIGRLFELLGEDTSILVTGIPGLGFDPALPDNQAGCFILASAKNPVNGELQGIAPEDLPPTLLALSGLEIPTTLGGSSFISDLSHPTHADLSAEDEQILRERLSGLGYIE